MNHKSAARFALFILLCSSWLNHAIANSIVSENPKNVLFIILDDLNDYVGYLDGHPLAKTPNIDKLAAKSLRFTNAYTNVPVCAPTRASLFTGIYAHKSKNYGFKTWYDNKVLANSKTMMEHFKDNGYHVLGSGKIMHHPKAELWHEFGQPLDYGPYWRDGEKLTSHPSVPRPYGDIGKIDGSFAAMNNKFINNNDNNYVGWFSLLDNKPFKYISEQQRSLLPDEVTANWATDKIQQLAKNNASKPFFMALGFIRPHTPLHVPEKYFKRFPIEKITLPGVKANDNHDSYYHKLFSNKLKGPRYFKLLEKSYQETEQGLKEYTQAYLAAVNFVDEQVGKVLDELERSGLSENTTVILTSDHGYTLGEKNFLFKNTLWQSSTHIPLLINIPGVKEKTLTAPVSHIDLFPTLIELSQLSGDTRKNSQGLKLSGESLLSYLQGDESAAPKYALSMIKQEGKSLAPKDHHYSIVTNQWRYILYNNGLEELYNRKEDPNEFDNLANAEQHKNTKALLKQQLKLELN